MFYIADLSMMRGQEPAPTLSPAQIKKKEGWAGDEKPIHAKCYIAHSEFILIDLT